MMIESEGLRAYVPDCMFEDALDMGFDLNRIVETAGRRMHAEQKIESLSNVYVQIKDNSTDRHECIFEVRIAKRRLISEAP